MNRPQTTLFLLMSVDGKISTGDADAMDFDRDLKRVVGVKEGLSQYYELEKWTDLFSLNTGKVIAKIGVNDRTEEPSKIPASFIIVDNQPHLTDKGIEYLSKWVQKLFLITTNKNHPAYHSSQENVYVIFFKDAIDFPDLFQRLKEEYGVDRLTIQSGGTLNALLLREGLIDHLSIVIAPVAIGGKITPTLIDGESLHIPEELTKTRALKLVKCDVLENSYLHVQYDVLNG